MKHKIKKVLQWMKTTTIRQYQIAIIALLLIVVGLFWLFRSTENSLDVVTPTAVGITPSQVESIREIGEWEFLTVETEELVDTVDRSMFSSRQLSRVYYGKVRLGINLKKTPKHFITMRGDTVDVLLPKIQLLDKDFVDEARTKSYFETGKWTNAERKQLYRRAYNKIYRRAMTRQNIATAQKNAIAQMESLLRAMGYEYVSVRFAD